MTTHLKIPALSSHPAAWMRVFQSKSSISATMFSGIGGFIDMHANQSKQTVKNNSKNNSVITLYANTNSSKRTHQQQDTDDEHDTKRCCCNPHSTDAGDGRNRSCEEGIEHIGNDVFFRPRLADYFQRGDGIFARAKKANGTDGRGTKGEKGIGMDKCTCTTRHQRAVQYVVWQGSPSTILFSTNGRG